MERKEWEELAMEERSEDRNVKGEGRRGSSDWGGKPSDRAAVIVLKRR